jgi:exodeoxyribonuclease VII large subunit
MTDTLTVTQLNRLVRQTLEGGLPAVWVEGEISNLASPPSGHLYFRLKDAGAQVDAAFFRNRNRLLRFRLRDGMQVRARGRVTLFEPRGNYQFVVEHLEESGLGALQRALEILKAKLAAEGLFAEERKRPLPAFPARIGVVTSPAGAAIHDILTVLHRRAPWIEVVLYPTSVQGAAASGEICAAIAAANRRAEVDVLIVGRGGGSLEDLWSFNEESVVRAIAASDLPVVSAVGHEVDVTLSDLAADRRAATPSAAAEILAPSTEALQQELRHAERQLLRQVQARIAAARHELGTARAGLVRPDHRLREYRQRIDELWLRGRRALRESLAGERVRMTDLQRRLRAADPRRSLPERAVHVRVLRERLARALGHRLEKRRLALGAAGARLQGVSPLATLQRGYAIVRDEKGRVLRRAADAQRGQALRVQLGNGELDVQVTDVRPE